MTALQSSITTASQTYFQKQKPFVHQDQENFVASSLVSVRFLNNLGADKHPMSRKFTVAKTNKMIQKDALLLDMQTCEVINRVSSTVDLEKLSVLSDLEKKFLWHPGYESSNFPQNLTNARVLLSTSIDHCLDHFESLEVTRKKPFYVIIL